MKKLVTHNQGFHADDVMAYAILKEVLTKQGETWTLTRSRDVEVINQGDIVFDIGEEYDPARNRYDHHQRGRAGARDNGVLYASAGLIWKHFGRELCSSDEVWQAIDQGMIASLDASDNGQDIVKESYFPEVRSYSIGAIAGSFEPTMFEEKTPEILLSRFEQASECVREILKRAIHNQEAFEQAFQEASVTYQNSADKQILIFEKNYERPTWRRLAVYPEPVFAVYRNDKAEQWKVEAIRKNISTTESRVLAPDAWRGRRDEELQTITGVADAQFCHPSGFLFGATSKEGALKLATLALEQ